MEVNAAMKKKARIVWWCAVALLYAVFFSYHSFQGYRKPVWNWDMVFYIAASQAYLTDDPQRIHDRTMEYGAEAYGRRGEESLQRFQRVKLWQDAESLRQALPYYTVKPLYVAGMLALHEIGIPLYLTTSLLSVAGFLMAGAVCFLMRPRGIDPGLWWLAVIAFCAAGRWSFMSLPHWSTPDTLCAALFVGGLCMWLYLRSAIGFAVCMLLSQLARPDTLMLFVLLTAFFALDPSAEQRMKRPHALIIAAAGIITYIMVNHLAGSYGIMNLFNYVFFNRVPYPAELGADFTVQQYLDVLKNGAWRMASDSRVQGLLAMSFLASFAYLCDPMRGTWHFLWLLWLAWAALAARFVILPAWWEDRYYYSNYFLMLYASAELIGGAWAARRARLRLVPVHGEG